MTGHLRLVSSQPGLDRAATRTLVCRLNADRAWGLDPDEILALVDRCENRPEQAIVAAFDLYHERNPDLPPLPDYIEAALNPLLAKAKAKAAREALHRHDQPEPEET